MKTMVSRTLSVHKEHELLLKLETAGLTEELAQMVIDSKGNKLATKVVRFIQNGGFEPTTSQKRSREIMGKNFFGVGEAIQYFGVNPSRSQLVALSKIPFSEVVLQDLKDTHLLVAVFPLSILEIRGKVNFKLFYDQSWYNEELFAKERGEASWQLVRRTPVSESTSKNWEDQQALIGEDDEVPTARVMVYTIIGHYLAAGEQLFKRVYVRTSSVNPGEYRFWVGYFDLNGLRINYDGDGYRIDPLGVSSSRKF